MGEEDRAEVGLMSIPNYRRQDYIERSILLHVYTNFEQPNADLQNKVSYVDSGFDSSSLDKWVALTFLSSGAGRRSETLLQADVYVRTKERGDADADRYGYECARIAHLLEEALHVRTIQLYSFATPSSPSSLTGKVALVQTSDGRFREPDSIQVWHEYEDDVARRTMTYRFVLPEDLTSAEQFDD